MADGNHGSTRVVVIVAIIGLLSTVGASALGGYWASRSADIAAESVQAQFESQRSAHIEDLRRAAYLALLQAALDVCTAKSPAELDTASKEAIDQAAQARLLTSDSDIEHAVDKLANGVIDEDLPACSTNEILFGRYVNPFIAAAESEVE